MYRRILAVFAFMAVLTALPVFAESDGPGSAWSLNDILSQGSRILTDTITQGLAIIQDRIELDSTTMPGPQGEESTHLRLKLFPKGKAEPDAAMSLEGTFRRSPDRTDQPFGFDFRIVPPKHKADPQDYI
jgi:hypothetical protein